jgi:rhamnogalacturonan endolyase
VTWKYIPAIILISALFAFSKNIVLLNEDFSNIKSGQYSVHVGAHTEYHFLAEAAPKGIWAVSAFRSNVESQLAWKVFKVDGQKMMVQNYVNKQIHTHPMLVAGDSLWTNYSVTAKFAPQSYDDQSGIVFRYQNDRCYYFLGVDGKTAVLKMVNHATDYHKPLEKVLAKETFDWEPGQFLTAHIDVDGERINAGFVDGPLFQVNETTFQKGKIGLASDVPTIYKNVQVITPEIDFKKLVAEKKKWQQISENLQAQNPKPVLWKKINTVGIGVGRNVRFGDLNNDGQIDVLIGQVIHHGPKDRNSELHCLTAKTFDGEQLWQIGTPDPWKDHLTNDVAFQVYDLNNDGKTEILYCKDLKMIVADGATGKTLYSAPTPKTPENKIGPYNMYDRILGDSFYICDLLGDGYPSEIIIKDRYRNLWAFDQKLKLLWQAECQTGHYPFAYDVDDDGRDEIAIGYSMFDENGKMLWSLDDKIKDHADGVAIARMKDSPVLLNAASDQGIFFADLKGNILKQHFVGHVQNPAIANFRDDLPGLEAVSINFWGNQGIIHLYNSDLEIYHDFEPMQYGSMCLPINWTGKTEEFFVLNPNVDEGGMYDGWGRRAVLFPDDGHPDMCNAVLDITGDCRDEVVVWDPNEMWVYTQHDNPRTGKLYKPKRNALYNYSNYQASVSLPGWSK